jgi:hypothetical protein
MLEKLFGARSFGGFINHLTYHQAIFFTFSNELNFIFMVQIVAPAFLGCWALIVPALVTCLQDDRHILLDVITHIQTNTSPFQITLRDVGAMLP